MNANKRKCKTFYIFHKLDQYVDITNLAEDSKRKIVVLICVYSRSFAEKIIHADCRESCTAAEASTSSSRQMNNSTAVVEPSRWKYLK